METTNLTTCMWIKYRVAHLSNKTFPTGKYVVNDEVFWLDDFGGSLP